MILKRIKFENPDIYQPERKLVLGDWILLGINGIAKLTYQDPMGLFWCGGGKTGYSKDDYCDRIFKPEFINWINSLHKPFPVDSRVSGFNHERKLVTGKVWDFPATISQEKLWVVTDKGTTTYINVTTAKALN